MTFANLKTSLETLTTEVYRWAAPAGKTRYIVLRKYGYSLIRGDDSGVGRFPWVQIDVYWQAEDDELLDDVLDLLDANSVGYDLQDTVWDDDLALFRGIITLELMPG